MDRSVAEVAKLFATDAPETNAGSEIYPGYPGLVFDGVALRTMTWGFPLSLKGKSGQPLKPKPVNNTRTDKLDSRFWSASFRERRCVIPMTAFAEAEGPKGGKTRTWFAVPDRDLFICAGIWRDSAEWGPCYSMVMTDASEAMQGVHNRMPVILAPDTRSEWLAGDEKAALALCRPWLGELAIDRTSDAWVRR